MITKLRITGIVSSLAMGLIFAFAAACLTISVIWPAIDLKFVSSLSDNWLLKIFKLQANIITNTDSLFGINLYDIGIIFLFILVCLALFEKFKYHYKIWFLISISLLVLGLLIFVITNLAGRSSFMLVGIIISSIFFYNQNKITGLTGIIANVLLLTADFTVDANIKIIPFLFSVGYLLLITWILMISRILIPTKNI